MYVERWNDLIIQTVAVQTFLPKKHVHWFNDFTYEHASINKKNILVYGGLAVGEGAGRNATAAGLYDCCIQLTHSLKSAWFQP